jgi:hypothetical protein
VFWEKFCKLFYWGLGIPGRRVFARRVSRRTWNASVWIFRFASACTPRHKSMQIVERLDSGVFAYRDPPALHCGLIKSRRGMHARSRSILLNFNAASRRYNAYQRTTLPAHQISIIESAERLVACFARLIAFLLLDRDQMRSHVGRLCLWVDRRVGQCQMGKGNHQNASSDALKCTRRVEGETQRLFLGFFVRTFEIIALKCTFLRQIVTKNRTAQSNHSSLAYFPIKIV